MFKKIILFSTAVLLFGITCFAQETIASLDIKRVEIQKNGMLVLGSWAALNIGSSLIFSRNTIGTKKYFHQMNGYWNTINLVLAAGSYLTAEANAGNLAELLLQQSGIEKILLFNAALDLGYMMGGAYLIERSKNSAKNPQRLKGFGQSVILQGGFLFAFDLIMYGVLHQNHLKIIDFTNQLSLTILPTGLTLNF